MHNDTIVYRIITTFLDAIYLYQGQWCTQHHM